jgi:hypothetical protein
MCGGLLAVFNFLTGGCGEQRDFTLTRNFEFATFSRFLYRANHQISKAFFDKKPRGGEIDHTTF